MKPDPGSIVQIIVYSELLKFKYLQGIFCEHHWMNLSSITGKTRKMLRMIHQQIFNLKRAMPHYSVPDPEDVAHSGCVFDYIRFKNWVK